MRAASQVASRRSRGVGMWGRARVALVGTRCGAPALPPVARAVLSDSERRPPAPPSLRRPRLASPGRRSSQYSRCRGLQLCTVAAWAWGWETAGTPRGSAGWGGKEPSKEDYEAINSRSCYWFRIQEEASRGTKSLPVQTGAPERNQTAGVQCPGKFGPPWVPATEQRIT